MIAEMILTSTLWIARIYRLRWLHQAPSASAHRARRPTVQKSSNGGDNGRIVTLHRDGLAPVRSDDDLALNHVNEIRAPHRWRDRAGPS